MLMIPSACYDAVLAYCRQAYPKEACGYLAGQGERVSQVYPMRNVEDSPIGYSMDPKEQLHVEKLMRQRNQRMIGIYHSHTATEAYPSSVDVSLSLSPDISYVLVSLKHPATPDFKSYRINRAAIIPERVLVDVTPPGTRRVGAG